MPGRSFTSAAIYGAIKVPENSGVIYDAEISPSPSLPPLSLSTRNAKNVADFLDTKVCIEGTHKANRQDVAQETQKLSSNQAEPGQAIKSAVA